MPPPFPPRPSGRGGFIFSWLSSAHTLGGRAHHARGRSTRAAPNIVFIFADHLGFDNLDSYGCHADQETPPRPPQFRRKHPVIFTSDNGPVLFDGYFDGAREKNQDHRPAGEFQGWKYQVYEGACRVPLIARWPARLQPRVSDQIFNLVDLPATLARLAGGTISPAQSPDSLDLSAVLLGTTSENVRDHTVLHGLSETFAIRVGDWKYVPATVRGSANRPAPANAADDRFGANRIATALLFNLRDDPGEQKNVITEHPDRAAELQRRLETLRQTPTPTPTP